jgi:hypothetical protein
MARPRRESHYSDGITDQKTSGPTSATKSAKAEIVAREPLERRHRNKSLRLAVNKDAYYHRREGEHDQKSAEYHNQPNTG